MNKTSLTRLIFLIAAVAVVGLVFAYASFSAMNTSGSDASGKWFSIAVNSPTAVAKVGDDYKIYSYAQIVGLDEPVNVSRSIGFVVTWNWTQDSEVLGSLCHGIFKGMRYAEIHAEKAGSGVLEGIFKYTDPGTGHQYLNKTYIQVTVTK